VVVLAANLVTGKSALISYLLSVPVFMLVLYLTRALAISIERFGLPALRPLLLTQLLFLTACLELCVFFGPRGRSSSRRGDRRRDAGRLCDGGSKCACADRFEQCPVNRGHDDECHAFHSGP
jgi:hypothetical protein